MSGPGSSKESEAAQSPARWGAVLSMSLCVFVLIASEFMPVSLLTPIASDLQVTEGQAGQAIAVSGAFAVLTSLFLSSVAGTLDRKVLLVLLTAVMAVSGTVVAFAPDYGTFMVGRALIGVVIGGFWSMSAAIAMRLVPEHQVARALAVFNGGNALATVIAPPVGSFLGGIIGWRGAFFCVVPLALLALCWQWWALPPMKARRSAGAGSVFRVLTRPRVGLGMAAVGLLFMGQFALFTYIRPFLEMVTQVGVSMVSLLLLVIGIAGFIGTSLIGGVLRTGLYRTLTVIPVILAGVAVALIAFGSDLAVTAVLLAVWGLVGTAAPVAWWTWLARSLPQDAEAGGGLMVAVIQLSIMAGATVGGVLFDLGGSGSTFGTSALLLLSGALLACLTGWRERRVPA